MPEKNKLYEAEITGITSEGSGVCRIDGMAVFVPETAVGDVLRVRIVKVLKSYAYGIIDELIKPSAHRTEQSCPAYHRCGGCVFRHMDYREECRVKEGIVRDAFERIGGLSPEYDDFIAAEIPERYRNKAQYPLAVHDGRAVCGFFAPRSHRVIPIDDCPLQPELFSRIVRHILAYINNSGLTVYDEATGKGLLRHIYLRRGNYSGEVMVCIVAAGDCSRQLSGLCSELVQDFPEIRSIVLNINPERTNVILGSRCVTLWGSDTIKDIMCGNTIEISPLSFYQVNTVQAERLYGRAAEYAALSGGETIADLYCGAGTIGLSMARSAGRLIGVEIIPDAVRNAIENAQASGITNAQFRCGDAGKVFEQLRREGCEPDVIVLDPPRKGCSEETLKAVVSAAPERIVMISCNPSTAARDAAFLGTLGYKTERISGADLFPRTRHVECVVLMSREK
ncbi:MAG: 23S rRNA (uracil(1939)-C(5))-methyltransferase RlmD [Ruminococcus sp.]|nr:23S rRNA (uracil(1939)-C(5))-methyltransferase RlmD [Ruminococcus sp.]